MVGTGLNLVHTAYLITRTEVAKLNKIIILVILQAMRNLHIKNTILVYQDIKGRGTAISSF